MATCEIHVGDIGTVFLVQVQECIDGNSIAPVDLSDATAVYLAFANHQGRTFRVPANFTTDGTDGQVQYSTVTGDLDAEGRWRLQVLVETPEGSWSSDVRVFSVAGNL